MIKKTTPTKRDLKMSQPLAKDFQFPFFKEDDFNTYIQKFMFSFKNIFSENINGYNLMFLTGPTKAGKSWMLRYNIRKFQASSQVS